MQERNLAYPAVSVSRDYGEYVDSIDIDVCAIADYLRARGISEDEIENLNIHFSGEEVRVGVDRYQLASYDHSQNYICMNSLEEIRRSHLINHARERSAMEKFLSRSMVHELEHKIARYNENLKQIADDYSRKVKLKTYFNAAVPLVAGGGAGTAVLSMNFMNEAASQVQNAGVMVMQLFCAASLGTAVYKKLSQKFRVPTPQEVYDNDPEELYVESIADRSDEQFVTITTKPVVCVTDEKLAFFAEVIQAERKKLREA
ncbi:hypothetical protein KC949_00300 [Candidatus Saccharibacteria bacterium]|nr:hypothetical protein [Candidatus Saccharibacteria bacterium]